MSEKNQDQGLVPTVSESELSMVAEHDRVLNAKQASYLFTPTPKAHVYKRPAKGGGEWDYVTGVYVKKVLNAMFGWNWSFEVTSHEFDLNVRQAFVLGKLTVNSNGHTIVKMQFGRVEIKFKTEWVTQVGEDGQPILNASGQAKKVKQTTDQPLDIGNDLKAAATDALKKCAAELGVASDVYAPNEFKAIKVIADGEPTTAEDQLAKIKEYQGHENYVDLIPAEDQLEIQNIVETKHVLSYAKVLKLLTERLGHE